MIEQRVTLRYGAQQIPAIVQAVQGDTGRDVIFELADYEIPAGATANYYIDKPDDTAIYNSAEVISSTEILAHLTEQALAAPGRNNGQVRILSDGEVITSFDFVLEVAAFRGILHMQSETEVNIFDQAIEDAATEAIAEAVEEIQAQTPAVTGMQNSIAPTYSSSSTYAVGDYVMYNAQLYKCTTEITTPEAWTVAHWVAIPLSDDVKNKSYGIRSCLKANHIYTDNLESGYYNSNTGKKESSQNYKRVPYLIPIDGDNFYYSETASEIQGALFDEYGAFIKRVYFEARSGGDPWLDYIPDNASYVGLYLKTSEPVTTYIELNEYDTDNISFCDYPFDNENINYNAGKWMDTDGTVRSNSDLALLTIVKPKAGDKYYVSNTSNNGICLDAGKAALTVESETVLPFGKIYTVPDGAKQINFNIRLADTKGIDSNTNNYVAKVTKGKILCIGDSITWLDGREDYGGMRRVSGWQMILREAGYDVRSAGYSGEPYATDLNVVDDEDRCIYNRIVTNAYDVSGYDYIILFGGTNDVLYNGALGERITNYASRTFDASTFNGAISGIISYIRENNPDAIIFLASFPKSEAASRIYPNASSRVREIEYNADFWSCKYINIFADMNVQPTYDGFDTFFYDVTHPNYNGMVRIGTLMEKALKQYN